MKTAEQDIGLKFLEEQEMERQRIARELHDSTVQNLTTLIHKTELCSKLILKDPVQVQLEMRMMSETLRNSINEMRDIIYDLRPMALDDLGLESALERFITQNMVQHDVKMNMVISGKKKELFPVVNMTLFRIITEACNNAIRHAKPDNVTIYINYGKELFSCKIEDDGCGFELNNESARTKNFGLSIMKERANLLKGEFKIHSETGKGTVVEVKIPV